MAWSGAAVLEVLRRTVSAAVKVWMMWRRSGQPSMQDERLRQRVAELEADSRRLEWLLRFLTVDDVGDESVCPGVIVDTDAMSDAFDSGALADESVCMMGGWVSPDMRRAIDKAMAWQARRAGAERS